MSVKLPAKSPVHSCLAVLILSGTLETTSNSSFYGVNIPTSDWARKLHHIRSPVLQHKPVKHFPTQIDAFNYLNQNQSQGISLEQLRVFSYEISKLVTCKSNQTSPINKSLKDKTGQRGFIVASLETFWNRYSQLEPARRYYYEIIQEHAPCHLYFDLEYSLEISSNRNRSSERILEFFRRFLCDAIERFFQIPCHPENIIELLSESEKKFSNHWIVVLPGKIVWKDNFHCGKFVKMMLTHLHHRIPIPVQYRNGTCKFEYSYPNLCYEELAKELQIELSDGTMEWFVDQGVYSRNRNFRLFGSCKRASSTSGGLYLSPYCQYKFPIDSRSDHQPEVKFSSQLSWVVFFHSLVCPVEETGVFLECNFDHQPLAHSFLKNENPVPQTAVPQTAVPNWSNNWDDVSDDVFVELDKFMLSVIQSRPGAVKGSIRSRKFYPDSCTVLYQVNANRYCENLMREHKSNHVFFLVDFSVGCFYQKCLDPDCRSFRGSVSPLPSSVYVPILLDLQLGDSVELLQNLHNQGL
jgi:DNA-directed primase/polymerase protein